MPFFYNFDTPSLPDVAFDTARTATNLIALRQQLDAEIPPRSVRDMCVLESAAESISGWSATRRPRTQSTNRRLRRFDCRSTFPRTRSRSDFSVGA